MRELLEKEYALHNKEDAVSSDNPDPILIAKKTKDEFHSLICALFAYGNVAQIVKFLDSLDLSLLDSDPKTINKELKNRYYRFQKPDDVVSLFIALRKLKDENSLQEIFLKGYKKEESVLQGVEELIKTIIQYAPIKDSNGFRFLIGTPPNPKTNSPLKRWNMYLRWMVREDHIDLGLWKKVHTKDLILPLDTHTFRVSTKLGLLKRRSADLKSALLITKELKKFCPEDPIKYDFALYRIGQRKRL